jgi:hypothetical protein
MIENMEPNILGDVWIGEEYSSQNVLWDNRLMVYLVPKQDCEPALAAITRD